MGARSSETSWLDVLLLSTVFLHCETYGFCVLGIVPAYSHLCKKAGVSEPFRSSFTGYSSSLATERACITRPISPCIAAQRRTLVKKVPLDYLLRSLGGVERPPCRTYALSTRLPMPQRHDLSSCQPLLDMPLVQMVGRYVKYYGHHTLAFLTALYRCVYHIPPQPIGWRDSNPSFQCLHPLMGRDWAMYGE